MHFYTLAENTKKIKKIRITGAPARINNNNKLKEVIPSVLKSRRHFKRSKQINHISSRL